ncbi:MAG: penicillin-binding protein 2 [Candidatus Uhrbacteria bacterium]
MVIERYHGSLDTFKTPGEAAPTNQEYIGRIASPRRVRAAFVFCFVVCLALVLRAVQVQIVQRDVYASAAANNRYRSVIIVPERGRIVDRNGLLLAENKSKYGIGVVPADLPRGSERQIILDRIADTLALDRGVVTEAINAFPIHIAEPITIQGSIDYDDAVRAYVELGNVAGVHIVAEQERVYREEGGHEIQSLAHVIGYLGRVTAEQYSQLADERYRPSDRIGKSGIESTYEQELRGTPGFKQLTINAQGRVVETAASQPAEAGAEVQLTIDANIQYATERALRRLAGTAGTRRGAAVMLDPNSGAVISIVSIPTFSGTAMSRGLSVDEAVDIFSNEDLPLFSRAISGTYPSGSTVKPVIAAAALEEGVVTEGTWLQSVGGLRVEQSWFPDWKAGGHGWIRVREAIAESVNTFFYLVGGGKPRAMESSMKGPTQEQALGPERIAVALQAFGFGVPTGIELSGEASGLVPTPEWKREERGMDWYIGDTYHLAIGQGDLLVTPLQVAVATAVFANGGFLIRPTLLASGIAIPSSIGYRSEVIRTVRTGMRAAVTEGSAAALQTLPCVLYGKTGTAEYKTGHQTHAWFTGFATCGDDQAVVTVLLEEAGEGSAFAVPVARDMFLSWINARNLAR